jgi:hypothetical protein
MVEQLLVVHDRDKQWLVSRKLQHGTTRDRTEDFIGNPPLDP